MASGFQFRGARSGDQSPAEDLARRALPATQEHYTVKEVATMWKFSVDTITRLFENEPDVLVIHRKVLGKVKTRHRTIRIPASALARKHAELMNGPREK